MTTPHETPAPTLRELLLRHSEKFIDRPIEATTILIHPRQLSAVEEQLTAPLRVEIDAQRARLAVAEQRLAKADEMRDEIKRQFPASRPDWNKLDRTADAYDAVPASSAGEDAEEEPVIFGPPKSVTPVKIALGRTYRGGPKFIETDEDTPPAVADAGSVESTLALLANKQGSSIREVVTDALHGDDDEPVGIGIVVVVNGLREQLAALRRDMDALKEKRVAELEATVSRIGEGAAWDAGRIDELDDRLTALEQPSAPVTVMITEKEAKRALDVFQGGHAYEIRPDSPLACSRMRYALEDFAAQGKPQGTGIREAADELCDAAYRVSEDGDNMIGRADLERMRTAIERYERAVSGREATS